MPTQRYISTGFWDDAWVTELDPTEKLFFIYLLTNPLTNIAGVYEITDKRIAFDLSLSREIIGEFWSRFERSGRAHRVGSWVIIPNWPKHQNVGPDNNIRKGIDAHLMSLPDDVYASLFAAGYQYIFLEELEEKRPPRREPPLSPRQPPSPSRVSKTTTVVSKTTPVVSNYLDTDLDLDTDRDLDLEGEANFAEDGDPPPDDHPLPPSPETKPASRPMPAMRDLVAQAWQDACTEHQPPSSWTNIGDERTACNTLAKKTKALAGDTGASETELIAALVHMYAEARVKVRRGWWAERPPVVPTEVLKRWSEVVTWVAERFKDQDRQRGSPPANGAKSEYRRARERALEESGVESV